jgi:hypothetical protein
MNTIQCYYKITEIPAYSDIILEKTSLKQKIINKLEMISKNNIKYKIIRYNKNFLCDELILIYGILKSVVLTNDCKVVCFSPPKSVSFDSFCKMYPENSEFYMNDIVAEEYVEGIMINLFWDKNIGLSGCWEISTRNNIGCYDIVKNNRTLRELFLESCMKLNMEFEFLEKRFCYSFVLQHPNFDLVSNKGKDIFLYLIKVYEIVNTEDGTVNIFNIELNSTFKKNANFTHIKFPEIYYNWNTYEELKENYASINTTYSKMGFIVYNKKTLVRSRMKNPNYEIVKSLSLDSLKNEYLYLHLKKEGKVNEYLSYYPKQKDNFWLFKKYLCFFTENLFQKYINCFIKKNLRLSNFQPFFKEHLKCLHKIYTTHLKPNKKYIKMSTVVEYVNTLNPSVLMYSLYLAKNGDEQVKISS